MVYEKIWKNKTGCFFYVQVRKKSFSNLHTEILWNIPLEAKHEMVTNGVHIILTNAQNWMFLHQLPDSRP